MENLLLDIRYAARTLFKNRVFTLAALACLALGIGANTAIFSVFDALLLRPLPYQEPDRLVAVRELNKGVRESLFSPADYLDYRSWTETLADVAAHRGLSFNLVGPDGPARVEGASVTPNYFELFGVQPAIGPGFGSSGADAGARAVVLSHRIWTTRFGADPGIVGTTLNLNGEPHTVVGVAPSSFGIPEDAELWVRSYRDDVPEPPVVIEGDLAPIRGLGYMEVVGRLAAGASLEDARAEARIIVGRREDADGEVIDITPLRETLVGDVRPALLVLLGAVGFVLLIACANVANLLLARATTREREVAIRAALGARRGRLLRQLLTENLMLALAGGVLGLLLAIWGVEALVRAAPVDLPRSSEIGVDARALAFTTTLALLTALFFGLLPSWRASRPDLQGSLREGGRSGSAGRGARRYRGVLVVAEVALSLVLLVGAGLLVRTMVSLQAVDLGFRPQNVLTMRLHLPHSRYAEETKQAAFVRQLLDRVRRVPGVSSAGATLTLPFSGSAATLSYDVEGIEPGPGEDFTAQYQPISPGYLETMGIRLTKGRVFRERDDGEAPLVAIVNEAMARRHWPGEDPLGRRIRFGSDEFAEIVGVVENVRHFAYDQPPLPKAYVPFDQDPWSFLTLTVRAERAPASLIGPLRAQVLVLDREQPVYAVQTMDEVLAASTAQRRFTMRLLGIFAAAAVVLALLGIYGVMSYSVSQRVHEYGIRMAIGAQRHEVVRMTMIAALRLVIAGVAIGLLTAAALGRFMVALLYGVGATDPVVFGAVTLIILVAAVLAAYLPARRASRVEPTVALRFE